MEIENKIKKYLINERKPNLEDYNIKDFATALTGEFESVIEDVLDNMNFDIDAENFDESDIAKAINLAVKNINKKKIIKNVIHPH